MYLAFGVLGSLFADNAVEVQGTKHYLLKYYYHLEDVLYDKIAREK